MEIIINEPEMEILSHLHEQVGCGPLFEIDAGELSKALGMDLVAIAKAISYLSGWGLLKFDDSLAMVFASEKTLPAETRIMLTSCGEGYVRAFEKEAQKSGILQVGKEWTAKGIKAVWEEAKDIASSTLAKYLKTMHE